jgi:hypothetical protein
MNDEEKNALARQVRFKELTKGFWAPDSAKEYAMKMSKKEKEPSDTKKAEVERTTEAKASSSVGSDKGS